MLSPLVGLHIRRKHLMSKLKPCPICNTDVFTEVVQIREKEIVLRKLNKNYE